MTRVRQITNFKNSSSTYTPFLFAIPPHWIWIISCHIQGPDRPAYTRAVTLKIVPEFRHVRSEAFCMTFTFFNFNFFNKKFKLNFSSYLSVLIFKNASVRSFRTSDISNHILLERKCIREEQVVGGNAIKPMPHTTFNVTPTPFSSRIHFLS